MDLCDLVYKFRAKCFEAYGLNKFRNFLFVDEHERLRISDIDIEAETILRAEERENIGLFAIGINDYMYAYIYDYETDMVIKYDSDFIDMDFFAEMDADYLLDGYALIIEDIDHYWSVVEE